ncbi:MAG: hypothetical protein HRU19_30320 [Pseudobacteriovorax sp.]|nr:hypothetical protein [Pseudobacteriovorax sp.]
MFLKKLSLALGLAVTLFSSQAQSQEVVWNSGEVELSKVYYFSGSSSSRYIGGFVSVQNIAYAKDVTAFLIDNDNGNLIATVPAQFIAADPENTGVEIWEFRTRNLISSSIADFNARIYVTYSVAGSTFGDSNSGADYDVLEIGIPGPRFTGTLESFLNL